MTAPHTEQNEAAAYPEERAFWDALVSVYRDNGINLPELAHVWAEQKCSGLAPLGAESDLRELCDKGCRPISLAIGIKLLQSLPASSALWRTAVGPPRRRKQLIRTLTKAADLIQSFHEAIGFSTEAERRWPPDAPAPSPTVMISSLRLYARGLNFFDDISRETGARSPLDVAKYLVSAYVQRATGTFHDRHVSALVGSCVGNTDYDETAHKMWRSRNYRRLNVHYASFADLLCAIAVVTDRPVAQLHQGNK